MENQSLLHTLPSEIGEDERLIFVAACHETVEVGLLVVGDSAIEDSNQRVEQALADQGVVDLEAKRQSIATSLRASMMQPHESQESLRCSVSYALWLLWNDPKYTNRREGIRWLAFGADHTAMTFHFGDEDGAYEAARQEITARLSGEPTVLH